jgi:hypothetical protein
MTLPLVACNGALNTAKPTNMAEHAEVASLKVQQTIHLLLPEQKHSLPTRLCLCKYRSTLAAMCSELTLYHSRVHYS